MMLTPNKEHIAEGRLWIVGNRPMCPSDADGSALPRELKPYDKIL